MRAAAGDLAARRAVAIGQRIVVRVTSITGDSGVLPRKDLAVLDREAGGGRMVGLFFDFDVRAARSGAALSIIDFHVHRVGAASHGGGVPAPIRAGALNRAAGSRITVGERIV